MAKYYCSFLWNNWSRLGLVMFASCLYVRPGHSCEHSVSRTLGNFLETLHECSLWFKDELILVRRSKFTATPCLTNCYLKNAFRDFHQIWHEATLGLQDELIRFWWSKVKGHSSLTYCSFLGAVPSWKHCLLKWLCIRLLPKTAQLCFVKHVNYFRCSAIVCLAEAYIHWVVIPVLIHKIPI